MITISFENNIYYYEKGKLYDNSFLEVPQNVSTQILSNYYEKIDYTKLNENELLTFIKEVKEAEQYARCLNLISFGAEKFSNSSNYLKTVFPIATSCWRLSGNPQKAIDFWMSKKDKFQYLLSVPLLTSLAAAYCDIEDYQKALYCINKAYNMQGGGKGYKNETSLVYLRIRKNAPELFED